MERAYQLSLDAIVSNALWKNKRGFIYQKSIYDTLEYINFLFFISKGIFIKAHTLLPLKVLVSLCKYYCIF